MSAEKLPEWLPDGWTMKVKMRKSGQKDTYYSSPSSGHTFRSKLEVLRYLKVKKVACQPPESMACFEDDNQHVVEETKDSPSWLPAGWLVEIKTRKSGGKYKSYFNPSTRSRFYTKAELFRYLKAGKSPRLAPKQKSSCNAKDTVLALPPIESSPDGLPCGWIKEIRTTWSASGLRRDLFYTHPVSGLVFRSKEDVFHYHETGEISKYAFSPIKSSISETHPIEDESPPLIAAKELKRHGNTIRRCLFSGLIPYPSCQKMAPYRCQKMAEDITQSIVEESCLLNSNHASPQSVGDSGPICVNSETQGKTFQVANEVNPACYSNERLEKQKEKSLKVVEKLSEPASRNLDKNSDKQAEGNAIGSSRLGVTKAKAVKMLTAPRRASKRLAGLEAESAVDIEFSDFALRKAKRAAMSKVTSSSKGPLSVGAHGGPNCPHNSEAAPVGAPESSGKQKGEELVEEQAECAMKSPFGDSWPDPCIEFAFKTLTGDLPVSEDTSVIQEYFQQLSSPQTQSPHPEYSAAYGGPNESNQLDILVLQLESAGKNQLPPGNDGFPSSLKEEVQFKGKAKKKSRGRTRGRR